MADWTTYAKDIVSALEKDGQAMTVTVVEQGGSFDIETGKRTAATTQYTTCGFVKNFKAELNMDPASVEVIFHPGAMPDLTSKNNVSVITAAGDEYTLENIQSIKPTTIVLVYKATGKRS